jgi:dihydrofolate synthase / folylpolyglutamate synthase
MMRAQGLSSLSEWLAWLETLHPKKIDLSLERIRAVLDRLNLRPPPYRVVTVGGTNGKGSCVALLESIYRAAGYRVGAFTSPHLWRFNERIRFNGEEASDAALVALFERIEAARGDITLSYFEFSAVAALLHFEDLGAEVAVLEVGLGGRLDAVNAVDADAALVASVDLDHQEWLGPDRESVGREKAGILRPGRAAVIADRAPPASLLAHAAQIGARLQLIGRDFEFEAESDAGSDAVSGAVSGALSGGEVEADVGANAPAGRWRWQSRERSLAALPRPLSGGDVQLANAAAAVAVVEALQGELPVAPEALRAGIAAARIRGRLERHLADGVEWLFDVAHNPAAARELAAALGRLPAAGHTLAVFSAMHDKDIAGVLAPFVDRIDEWFVAQSEPERGATAAQIGETLARLGARVVRAQPDVETACRSAQLRAGRGDRVLVFGSFYLVGPAMQALGLYCAPTPSDQSARWTGV